MFRIQKHLPLRFISFNRLDAVNKALEIYVILGVCWYPKFAIVETCKLIN